MFPALPPIDVCTSLATCSHRHRLRQRRLPLRRTRRRQGGNRCRQSRLGSVGAVPGFGGGLRIAGVVLLWGQLVARHLVLSGRDRPADRRSRCAFTGSWEERQRSAPLARISIRRCLGHFEATLRGQTGKRTLEQFRLLNGGYRWSSAVCLMKPGGARSTPR
jgi:hypothetical protein